VEVKRLAVLIALAVLLGGLVLLGSSDTVISIADTDIPDHEVTGSINTTDNSDSSSTSIVITMYTLPDK